MTTEEAIKVIALHAISSSAESFTEEGWENYPEIGGGDWLRVLAVIEEIRPRVEPSEYHEAYTLLERRAEHS